MFIINIYNSVTERILEGLKKMEVTLKFPKLYKLQKNYYHRIVILSILNNFCWQNSFISNINRDIVSKILYLKITEIFRI